MKKEKEILEEKDLENANEKELEKKKSKEEKEEKRLEEVSKQIVKRFKNLKIISEVIEILFIIPAIVLTIMAITIMVQYQKYGYSTTAKTLVYSCTTEYDENWEEKIEEPVTVKEFANFVAELRGRYYFDSDSWEESSLKSYSIYSLVEFVLSYITVIFIINTLRKLFEETEKNGTPFTKNNIKYLKMVDVSICIIWWLGMIEGNILLDILVLTVVSVLTLVFKYGYKLQKESDETI
jgi:hypothetical protein